MFHPLSSRATSRPNDNSLSRLVFYIFLISAMLLSSMAHAIPLAGTEIGTQASATYSIASGNDVQVFSNKVKTTIKALSGLTLEGATYVEGKQVLLTTVVNTGNVKIAKLAVAVTSLTGVKTYSVNGNGILSGTSIDLTDSAIESGATFQFTSVIDAETDATATIKVIGYDAADVKITESADWVQTSYFTDATPFDVVVSTPKVTLAPGKATSANFFNLGLMQQDIAKSEKRVMAFDITFGDSGKGLEFHHDKYMLTISDGNQHTTFQVGTESQWSAGGGQALKAKLLSVDAQTLRLVIELNETQRADLNFPIAAKNDAAQAVHRFNGRFGEADWASGKFTDPAKVLLSSAVQVTVENADAGKRSVTISTPKTDFTAVEGQILSLHALVKNNGKADDKIILSHSGVEAFDKDTVFSWNDPDVTTNETEEQELALAAGEERLLTFSVKLPPHAPIAPQVAMLDGADDPVITLSVQPKGMTEPADKKSQAYTINVKKRGVVVNTENNTINYLVDATSAMTVIKLTLKNSTFTNTTNPSHDLYDLTAELTGLDVSLYAPVGGSCGPAPTGATASMTSDRILAGKDQDICVAAIGENGGLVAQTSAELTLTVTPTLANSTVVIKKLNLYLGRIEPISGVLLQEVVRGGSVDYVYQINNTGAAALTIGPADVAAVSNKKGWTSTFTMLEGVKDSQSRAVETLIIAPDASGRIALTVTAPMDASPGEYAATTLSISGKYEHSNDIRALLSVIYTAQVKTEGGTLVKQQALDASCNVSTPAYSQDAIDAGPGQCVWYQVQLTNTAEAAIDKVKLTDTVSRHAVIQSETITLKSATGVGKADVANGSITGTYDGQLTKDSTLTLEYRVKIAE